ncbi:RNA-binding cell elongation regulator Jag/EloR [Paenisporosarcina sp. OV554]|uniref:RNA-binding cell elongation regulator Jag/EloR n=1 Tax=Paenisporosarcina sp. OV554 TaxID=2135694 RepID=UPI000D33B129|nr:RNA-binding cell elongation regulator Jag/EloR [Paenisporosarcina sp. OV554]PUB11002.1 spoIIIJ-associated protein [Paenisporosarcina sp. OV554]
MNQITQTGTTTEKAISTALVKLGTTIEQVTVNVLTEGKKGFLGFGSRLAEVQVTVKNEKPNEQVDEVVLAEPESEPEVPETKVEEVVAPQQESIVLENTESTRGLAVEEAKKYLKQIAEDMKIDDLIIETVQDGKYVTLRLESKKAAVLIGKRGQTLNALQQLSQLVANKYSNQFLMIQLDVENYRERRQESLEQLAERMADKAIRTGKKVEFEPMPSYERKVIHHALSRRLDIETVSVGTDPNRYLVIEPLK